MGFDYNNVIEMRVRGDEIIPGDWVKQEETADGDLTGVWNVLAVSKSDKGWKWVYKNKTSYVPPEIEIRWTKGRWFRIGRPAPMVNEFGPVSP